MDMDKNYTFQHLDISLDTNCAEDDVFQVVTKIRPEWAKDDVIIKRLSGGYLNKTFSCLHKNDTERQEDGLFVRVNGPNKMTLSRILPMGNEITYIKEMNKHGIGAPLMASFNNGIILKFLKGKLGGVTRKDP